MRGCISMIIGLAGLAAVIGSGPARAQTGVSDLVYTPLKPCRLFDTGKSDGDTVIRAGAERDFLVAGTGPFEIDGGTPGGCGVPPYATAAVIALSARSPADGRLSVFATPFEVPAPPPPVVNVLSYQANVVSTSQANVGLSKRYMRVFTTARARVWGDVTGYFAPAIEGQIAADGTRTRTTRIQRVVRTGTGYYNVYGDRDMTGCVALGTALTVDHIVNAIPNGIYVLVITQRVLSGGLVDSDAAFSLRVTCP